jgi:hypothetical protein
MKQIPIMGKNGVGKFALVDDEDFEELNQRKWRLHPYGYAHSYTNGSHATRKDIFMHRIITNCPPDKQIDHKDGNGLNNQEYNLRICTVGQNAKNRKVRVNSKSGYKGVYARKRGYFQASINVDNKFIHIGMFRDPISAAHAYDKKAKEVCGGFAWLNFPD